MLVGRSYLALSLHAYDFSEAYVGCGPVLFRALFMRLEWCSSYADCAHFVLEFAGEVAQFFVTILFFDCPRPVVFEYSSQKT